VQALRDTALRLDYMIGQITPGEFHWEDANYDRNSALGRELLFLIADTEWVRASSEAIDILRSDTVETTINIDVDLDHITHEAFRERTGRLWLPVLVLPPLQQWLPEPDPFSTLTVTDASGAPLVTLPNSDVRHRIAAALTEIIISFAATRLLDTDGQHFNPTRDHRLILSAAIYRLLRGEHVPKAVLDGEIKARQATGPQLPRIDRMRHHLGDFLKSYADLLTSTNPYSGTAASPDNGTASLDDGTPASPHGGEVDASARHLTERAIRVLRAFAESAVVVVAAERGQTPAVLTVRVPSRALHLAPARWANVLGPATPSARRWARPGAGRWLHPGNWVLPRASLQLDLLLPSADADRQVQVNLPDGISPDPSRPLAARAELDIRTEQPIPFGQLADLTGQLVTVGDGWPDELQRCLADLAGARADAARESLRDHRIGASRGEPFIAASTSATITQTFRERLDELIRVLREISAHGTADVRRGLDAVWQDGAWLHEPMQRRTSTDAVSPGTVAARARKIEEVSQRAAPTEARMQLHVAVTDSEYFSTATLSGVMSALLMSVVLVFFACERMLKINGQQVSAEVLALVLTLFSAIQAGRIERPDRSTMRGLLVPAGNPLIVASILPPVILAVAIAFSRSAVWAATWAASCVGGQVLLLSLQRLLLWRALHRGLGIADTVRRKTGLVLYTDAADYSYNEVLHSGWWRRTTADALLAGRPAYGYVVWQHRAPQTLHSLLHGARPASDSGYPSRLQPPRMPDWRRGRRPKINPAEPASGAGTSGVATSGAGTSGAGTSGAATSGAATSGWRHAIRAGGAEQATAEADLGISALEQPANVLALQRSGTGAQSVNFAVFRDQPKADWDSAPEDIIKVDLDPGRLAPAEDATGIVGIFLGFSNADGLPPVSDHPVTAVLRTAAKHRLTVFEVQLPVPAPATAYADLRWARVQLGLRNEDVGRLPSFLSDIHQLTVAAGAPPSPAMPHPARLVAGVQTVAEGIPRILNPREMAANPGPAAEHDGHGATRLVLASHLDVVAASGMHKREAATAKTWRLMAICADARSAIETKILASLPADLGLGGLTFALLHGKAVMLLLGHHSAGQHPTGQRDDAELAVAAHGGNTDQITVYLDKWQSREDLGAAQPHPLLRVHMRTPDRPGATLEVLESLREALGELAPGSLGELDWNVWYARAVVADGDAAVIQMTIRLDVDPAQEPSSGKPVSRWEAAEFSRIEQQALALAARKMAASGHSAGIADAGLDAPADTVIRVGLVNMPDLNHQARS
jgi:hypothetical protein